MSSDDGEDVVRVLYDYSYADDTGNVTIKAGDLYRLVEQTNKEWWQVYDASNANGECFFVPAQYVAVVSEVSPLKVLSNLDKHLSFEESSSHLPDHGCGRDEGLGESHIQEESLYANTPGALTNSDADGEYMNLDQFRDASRINPLHVATDLDPKSSSENVSLCSPTPSTQDLIHGTIPPPLPEEGKFVKVLLVGMPWDIYKENTLQRLYYVNRETGERMWRPPRRASKPSDQPKSPVTPVSPPCLPTLPQPREVEVPDLQSDYEQIHDNGNLYFVHKSTQDKNKDPSSSWDKPGHRLSTFGGQSMRAPRAVSTYGQLESTAPSKNKSCTLPANFTVARPAPVANDRLPSSKPSHLKSPATSPLPHIQEKKKKVIEIFCGYLNKAKIADVGKKKVKKNWNNTYVVLQGSNLVFYKDQKAAPTKAGSPHGRPEGVITLQGAHVELNPSKDITSKKNTVLLMLSSGVSYLFQSDTEKNIREWWTKMKIVANDVTQEQPSSPTDNDKKNNSMSRSMSVLRSSSESDGQGLRESKAREGIRHKLLHFIGRRPTQEDLIKRGIMKDTVFGSLLRELCEREKNRVPKFVNLCIAAVESRGLVHDGMYRVSGNLAEIQRLRCAVDKDDGYNLYDTQWDVHVLTGSLKLFFRELKEPAFPAHMYDRFCDAVNKNSRKDRLSSFKAAVSDLPGCNYFTLKELFQHLCKVCELSHENRMQTQNVAIVFGPTLCWHREDPTALAIQSVVQSKIVELCLVEYRELFTS